MSYNIRNVETGEIIKIADVGSSGGGGNVSEEINNIDFTKTNCKTAIPKKTTGGKVEIEKAFDVYDTLLVKENFKVERGTSVIKICNNFYYVNDEDWYLITNNNNSYILTKTKPIDNRDISTTDYTDKYIWSDGENEYFSYTNGEVNYQYIFDKEKKVWEDKIWNNFSEIRGNYIWNDGENIYYSYGSGYQYILNKETNTWETKNWEGLDNLFGYYIWSNEGNIYYSNESSYQYKLNKETNTWETKNWEGFNNFSKDQLWSDGENFYCHGNYSTDYKLNKETNIWETIKWNIDNIDVNYIWSDGKNTYYSKDSSQYILNIEEGKWESLTSSNYNFIERKLDDKELKVFESEFYCQSYQNSQPKIYHYNNNSSTNFWEEIPYIRFEEGKNLEGFWSEGENEYYSVDFTQYKLNKETNTWETKNWEGLNRFYAENIWSDGDNLYCSKSKNEHYKFNKNEESWEKVEIKGLDNIYNFSSGYIWSDGENIYYSYYDSEGLSYYKIFDKATLTWTDHSATRITDGSGVWTDGDTLYYSINEYGDYYESYHVDLFYNKVTSKWEEKKWNVYIDSPLSIAKNGDRFYLLSDHNRIYYLDKENDKWVLYHSYNLKNIYADEIWSDGENIYCSNFILNDSVQDPYWAIFNLSINNFSGSNVWTDGIDIYYSDKIYQYKLTDKLTKTWEPYYWYGPIQSFIFNSLWTDGQHLYSGGGYGYYGDCYVLNEEKNIWENTNTNLDNRLYSKDTWSDGENTYFSQGYTQYKLNKETNEWEDMTWKGLPSNFQSYYLYGKYIWKDNQENIYVTPSYGTTYILDKNDLTWSLKTWEHKNKDKTGDGLNIRGDKIWSDGKNIYYSDYNTQYILLDSGLWDDKIWNITDLYESYIWKDENNNVYYSNGIDEQYKLNKQKSIWEPIVWNIDDINKLHASDIWLYNNNIYCGGEYKLNKETNTWERVVWGGPSEIDGKNIWSDGENIYYSYGIYNSYKLNKKTNTWEKITWEIEGASGNWQGRNVWSDGENIYYNDTYGNASLILDKTTNTWKENKWTNLSQSFEGEYIWTNGEKIFYSLTIGSDDNKNYIFNLKTKQWEKVIWKKEVSDISFYDKIPWTDGKNYYLDANDSEHYYKITFD